MKNRTIYLALLLIAISFLSGCTYNVPPIDTTFPPNRYIEKLPITVGVYFSEEFQSYEIVHQMPQTAVAYRIRLGPPSVALFNQIFSEMFEKVVEVSSLPPLPETEDDIKAVIKPSIKPFIISLNMGAHPEFTFISVDLDYMIDLFDLNGVLIDSWSIKGSGTEGGFLKQPSIATLLRDATQTAMRRVATQYIMVGFRRNAHVKKWLKSTGNTDSN